MVFFHVFVCIFAVNYASSHYFAPPRFPKQSNCPLNCPTAPQPTCPCMKPKNSSKCFAYDSRLQATSIDEAMFSFPDISDYSPNPSTLVSQWGQATPPPSVRPFGFAVQSVSTLSTADAAPAIGGGGSTGGACTSKECQACRLHVVEGFSQALNASTQFQRNVGSNGKRQATECQYVQSKQKEKQAQQAKISQMNAQNHETVDQMVNLLKQATENARNRRDVNDNGIDDGGSDSFTSVDESDLKDKLLGVSTKISCDYVRGETLSSGTPWCGLCNICWTWRKLPPEYFPSYLNEVSCDSDNACLAGFGKCRPVLRALTVLKNIANGSGGESWEQQQINTIAACECQVEAGTPLHSFIVR